MVLGTPGSEFCEELNRLANGGTYPARTDFLAEQGAANKWAGTTGKSTVAALNYKLGRTDPSTFLDLQGVCNALAGTSGKGAVSALRGITS